MRALLALVHYFKPEINPSHTSVDERRRANRTAAIETVIRGYRGQFGPSAKLRFRERDLSMLDPAVELDIHVVTVPGCSLLSEAFRRQYGVVEHHFTPNNPRLLGFCAYRVFETLAQTYDWFLFSEDDLAVRDPLMFDKLSWFNRAFGDQRVLSPNRLEWNPRAYTLKTYIDGDITRATFERLTGALPDDDILIAQPLHSTLTFQRARNPHSGFFAVTRAQLAHWMAQPHWLDHDVSFVSPLESAATLGLTKTFSVYKPLAPAGFLEVEHLDDRFSCLGFRPAATPQPPASEA